ncbi:oligosaccharide flippase family protein [Liquorilactobacillus hordei]|uniref:oligosaccharide flippase family protein n=1 Tax=Liquorilactobacillus hordei TaxID=468911 RepID=UPI001CBD2769|nr:oligosaccharide flippase family protein [Liquorilactobacillus hordei]MBZ2405256.1 flippase [Liquorilactobacillus hordei]
MKNIIKNFFYQSLFQVLKIIMPIITIPIVSKALGPSGVGVYNYTNSVAQFFALFAGLGITTYANREIAIAWGKKDNFSQVFWDIFSFKFLWALLVLIIYCIFSFFTEYKLLFFIQSLIVLSVLVDISWFFMGIEDFKKTSLVSFFVQFFVYIGIIFLVKSSSDLIVYTLLQCLGIFLSQAVVWSFIFKYVRLTNINFHSFLKHIKGSFQFFIPQVSIVLYNDLNKTLLGLFVSNAAVGYYANSTQLNNVIITFITTLDYVLLPHMTTLYALKSEKKIVEMMEKTVHFQLFLSIPIMFGMLTIYDKLVPWFFGNKFLFINNVIPYMTILIVIIPLGMSISRQFLMPVGKIGQYNRSVILGAVISILLNAILLPTIGFFGVVIANITAEFFVTITRLLSFLKDTDFTFDLKKIFVYSFASVVMYIVTRELTDNLSSSIVTNLIQIVIAMTIYIVIVTLFKQNVILDILKKVLKKKRD